MIVMKISLLLVWADNRKPMTNVHFDGEEIYQGVISADIESLVKLMTYF